MSLKTDSDRLIQSEIKKVLFTLIDHFEGLFEFGDLGLGEHVEDIGGHSVMTPCPSFFSH